MEQILKTILNLVIAVILLSPCYAEEKRIEDKDFDLKTLILPVSLMTYGVIGMESETLKFFNSELKEEVNEHIDEKVTFDDFSQYAPFVTVYALNGLGIEGKNSFKDRTIILGTAYSIMGATVLGLKHISSVKRPDGSSRNSFPSGHTATAFMGAEFLYQEYKDVSAWIGLTGYAVAAGTGAFRMYNDRHWLTDVAAGAGFGILSTKLSYMIHNKKRNHQLISGISPYYNNNRLGISIKF